ncbi:hypothetical protein [Lacisediminihabitans sp. H27-G8]|uniref:hypothetical protein n=1 Tax=Lacisediminihabitans sp. H27-G8 TaxID=3111909 RepID=UPI0038FBEC42
MRIRARRLRAGLAREDGFASEIIILPGLFLILITALQGALWYLGSNVAQTAAIAAYNNARAYQSAPAIGQTAANQIIDGMPGFLEHPQVDITRTPTTVTVTITGTAESLIPGVQLPPVTRTITGPVERWVPAP